MTHSLLTNELVAPVVSPATGFGTPPAPRTLLDVFAATVKRHRRRTAIDAPDAVLTYAELARSVGELADELRALGVGPGDRVGVYVRSGTAQLYIAILGALHADAAYVPVDADDPPARAEGIWDSVGACVVIEDGLRIRQLAPPLGADTDAAVDDDAWVIFTSGSSGRPKGVAITHRSAAAFVDAEAELWTVVPEDRVLAGLSVGFDASCEEMWLAWRHGAALIPAPRSRMRAASDLGPWLAERGVTVISTVPTLAAMWDDSDLSGVRLLILGGEACPEPLVRRLAADREVWNTYGPTEATVVTTATRLNPDEPVTIGWPLNGWQVAVVDEFGAPVPIGQSGELVICGVGLGRYLDPALDAERYAALPALGWERAYRTGDMVCETITGLEFIGRRDDQVKIGGRRLELGEVDALLRAVPGVAAAAATVQKTAAGNALLVGYVVGDVGPTRVRTELVKRLPHGISPVIVPVASLPLAPSGKVDRKALPWPPPATHASRDGRAAELSGAGAGLSGTAAWLAERWAEHLGPMPFTADSDFFESGGSSVAAAKLVSALRARYPAVAVADVYAHRQLGRLAERLEELEAAPAAVTASHKPAGRRSGLLRLAGLLCLLAFSAPQWLLGILTFDRIDGGVLGARVGWAWLIGGWLVFGSAAGRAAIVLAARWILLPRVRPGRYSRHGWVAFRLWFLERLEDAARSAILAGTPLAARYARLCGHSIGKGARLGTLPPMTSLISIGQGATIESDVDLHGWWVEGDRLIIDEVRIGAEARVGARTVLSPGADVGSGAEIEPGSVVSGRVPAGERWAGSPARRVGLAGDSWSQAPRPESRMRWSLRAMYFGGLGLQTLLPLIAAGPGLLVWATFSGSPAGGQSVATLVIDAPLLATSFMVTYGLLVAVLVRCLGSLVRPGVHPDDGITGWALWLSEGLMAGSRGFLFSLYSSIYIRPWLRLAGIRIGRRAEISTAVGLNRLTSFAPGSFSADDVALAGARARGGWLEIAPIEVGSGTFLGNSAIIPGGAKLGDDCLVGVLTTAPARTPDGTSWFGMPALEFPRVSDPVDSSRTTEPPRRLILARGTAELIRILLPASISVVLGTLVFWGLAAIGRSAGIGVMALASPLALLAAGVLALAATVGAKWVLMGRYRPGEHPLWSFFVWRDEIINSLQEQLAGAWLLDIARGTPLMSIYLRAMGAKVGRDVWCETLNLTEFDVVELGDGCVLNRHSCVETHLFHDRLMRIGPATLGPGSTLGPVSAMLPDTVLGRGASVGARSVVLRGEELPPGTSWHGAPVVAL